MKDVSFLNTETAEEVEVYFAVTGIAEGRQALLQQVIILTLTSAEDPARLRGAGFLSDLQTAAISEGGLEELKNLMSIALKDVEMIITEQQVRRAEIVGRALSDEETLADIVLRDVALLEEDHLQVKLDIITVAGEPLAADLTI